MQINNAICQESYHRCLKISLLPMILAVWVLTQPHSNENKRTVAAAATGTAVQQQHAYLEARFTERTMRC